MIDTDGFPMTVCRQGSNLYAVFEPAEHAERLPVHHAAPRQFPSAMFAALARMLALLMRPGMGSDTGFGRAS